MVNFKNGWLQEQIEKADATVASWPRIKREVMMVDNDGCEQHQDSADDRLQRGRDYLMSVRADEITVEDALEAFGFGRDGMDY